MLSTSVRAGTPCSMTMTMRMSLWMLITTSHGAGRWIPSTTTVPSTRKTCQLLRKSNMMSGLENGLLQLTSALCGLPVSTILEPVPNSTATGLIAHTPTCQKSMPSISTEPQLRSVPSVAAMFPVSNTESAPATLSTLPQTRFTPLHSVHTTTLTRMSKVTSSGLSETNWSPDGTMSPPTTMVGLRDLLQPSFSDLKSISNHKNFYLSHQFTFD
mmetsp:Transcript_44632/g.60498  ORF Transcript_44632/g.60498 Transcript_44632/m.60498 type:complete len:214 (+) Transcript_44632:467-1108(+)